MTAQGTARGVETEIRALIDRYLTAWNARDLDGVAAQFTEPARYVLPGANLHMADRPAIVAALTSLFAGLEANGFDHSEAGALSVRICNETTVLAELRDVTRLRRDGSVLEVIDALYVCLREDGQWRLSVAIACDPARPA